jgi:hypothetical protein
LSGGINVRRDETKLCYIGHATMENRHGLAVAAFATGTAERCVTVPRLMSKE